jgi:hypothetical protein
MLTEDVQKVIPDHRPVQESAQLDEVRRIIEGLESRFESLSKPDKRFVLSWRQYLDRTGAEAHIGVYRLALVCATGASYGVVDEKVAVAAIAEAIRKGKWGVENG